MEIIRSFMPEQLSDEKVREICVGVIAETGASGLRDMGKCVALLKERYPARWISPRLRRSSRSS